jgi:uncharacterized membrane protein
MKFLASPRRWLLAALLLLPFMITNDSLWLDEGDTAEHVAPPDLPGWWQDLQHDGGSDAEMPLAGLCSWVWGKLWGTAEWQLRAVNVLWGALALAGMYRVGKRLQLPGLPLLLAVQPYFWFYTNEARPYALQVAGGAWLLAALVEFCAAQAAGTAWAWLLAGAGFFLFCTTLLAPLPVAATVAAGAFIAWRSGWRSGWRMERRVVAVLFGGLAACVPVGIYYLTTLLRGAKGAQIWPVDLKFIAYVFYELTGMGGIGLSGEEIRELARSPHLLHELSVRAPQLLLPLLALGMLVAIFWLGLRRISDLEIRRRLLPGLWLVLALTAGVFITISFGLHKAFWARHYAPVFPAYVTLLGLAIAGMWANARPWQRLLPGLLCGMFLWSALNFRFAPALRKEDYRAAAAYVRPLVAQGQSVWWLAGGHVANYYGLATADFEPEPGKVFIAFLSRTYVRALPPPAVIVLNKPDVHDPHGSVQQIIADDHYQIAARYQGFVIWTNAAK